MFNNIQIDNYRNFSALRVDRLSRVNVFVGKNNSGKSCLLEAVFLLTGVSNPRLLLSCNTARDFPRIDDFSFFFHNAEADKPITIASRSSDAAHYNRRLTMRLTRPGKIETSSADRENAGSLFSNLSSQQTIVAEAEVSGVRTNAIFINTRTGKDMAHERGEISIPDGYQEKIRANFMPTKFSTSVLAATVREMVKSNKEDEITAGLRLIDARVRGLSVAGDETLLDMGLSKKMPINFLGDGVRKMFALIVSIIKSRDGVLLVDEIDNGLYHSTMRDTWALIVAMAKTYNVQIFATTHNADSLRGIYSCGTAGKDTQAEFSLYKLIKGANDKNVALHYDYAGFASLLETENDIR